MNTQQATQSDEVVVPIRKDRVDAKHLLACLKKAGASVHVADSVDVLVFKAREYYEKNTPAEHLVQCDYCGGVSDDRLEACPFCNDNPGQVSASNGAAAAAQKETTVDPKEATKKTPKAPKSKPTPEAKANGKAHVNGKAAHATAIVPADPAPLAAKTPASAITLSKESDLDVAVADIRKLKVETVVGYKALGLRIKDVYDQQLWKLRTAEGKQRYKNVDAFFHIELGMTPDTAYGLIDMAARYSDEQIQKFGATKLKLLCEAPKEDQPRIMGEIERGASKREVEKIVREVKKKKNHRNPRRDTGTVAQGTVGEAGGRKRVTSQIAVANMMGTVQVKLYKRPSGSRQPLKEMISEGVRARRLADEPFGMHELANDVVQIFTVQESPSGELVLKIKTKRVE